MPVFQVQTDAFCTEEFEATDLDAAITEAFDGEGLGKIVDEDSLRRKFAKYARDGGWVRIEKDGEEVLAIGEREYA